MVATVDAVVCLSGDGLARVQPSITLAETYRCALVLAGSRDAPPEAYHWLDVLPYTTALPAARVWTVDAENTWEQAVNVVALARERGWVTLVIVASGWHVIRAWLTFVRALGGVYDLRLYPYKVASPRMDTAAFLAAEMAKLTAYRLRGHCADDGETLAYLTWREAA